MNFSDPSTYISLLSSILLILSEILPFLPCKSNGLVQIMLNLIDVNRSCLTNAAIKDINDKKINKQNKDDDSADKTNSCDNSNSSSDKNISDSSEDDVIIKIHLEDDDEHDEDYNLIENNIFNILAKMKSEKITDKQVKIKLKQLLNDLNELNHYL